MRDRESNRWRALTCLLACAACSDPLAIVGRLRVVRDDSAVPEPPDSGPSEAAGGAGTAPPAMIDMMDSSVPPVQTGDAGTLSVPKKSPSLAPPPRQKPWNIEPGSRDQFCAGKGNVLRSASDCVPIERQLFAYGICTCGDVKLKGDAFTLDAFDSSQASSAPGQGGVPMGVNGTLQASAKNIQLGGSLIVTGSDALSISSNTFSVRGDLESNAPLAVSTQGVRIGRDAYLAADVRGPGTESIGVTGTAYTKPGVMGTDALRGRTQQAEFALSPPCNCDELLDIPGIVAAAQAFADNDAANFPRDSLKNRVETSAILVPCGRMVLSELSIPVGTVALTITGRTALFIEGDVNIVGTFAIYMPPGAELDLFIAGDLKLQGSGSFGTDAQRPSALRIYVGGQVSVVPNFTLFAALYAPQSAISGLMPESWGSVFAASFTTEVDSKFHYDRSIVNTTVSCQNNSQVCSACDECANGLACIAGSCSACTRDSDCCAPFVCASGRCDQLMTPAP